MLFTHKGKNVENLNLILNCLSPLDFRRILKLNKLCILDLVNYLILI